MGMEVGGVSSNWTLSPVDYATILGKKAPTVFDTIDDSTRATAIAITDLKEANASNKPPADT